MENLLRVARALGVLDQLVEAIDPYQTRRGPSAVGGGIA